MELLNRILRKENLKAAYEIVVRNKGSAGVDGIGTDVLKSYLQENWSRLKQELESGRYYPEAVLGVTIPKRSGGKRLLGIPTTSDRMIQQAIHQELSPLFEPDFSPYSYGFRPVKSAGQAIVQARQYINQGHSYIVDIDLKSFFDEVNHDYLMNLIKRKVGDRQLLRLIWRYLRSPVQVEGKLQKRRKGVPQGGPLSPLLSNIVLNELDKELDKRGLRFVRYADDFSIFLKTARAAHRVKRRITRFIEDRLHLKVNTNKSAIRRPLNYEYLGYAFESVYRKGVRGQYQLVVSKESLKELKHKIKSITRKTIPASFDERIDRLNLLMRGWLQYFKHASIQSKMKTMDGWVRNRLRYCIWHHWKKPKRRVKNLIRLGVEERMAWQWGHSKMGGWAVSCSPILGTTITLERLKSRGYKSFLEYYLVIHC
jgi:group II intron reverse transcriptase/maturase